jgi:RNA polymerase sigma-70 factor (ECF subfamily)
MWTTLTWNETISDTKGFIAGTPVASETDERLVQRCLSGEQRAAEMLFTRHQTYVYRICLGMVRNPHDAEDIAQDAFITALSRLKSYGGRASFRSWLHRVTINTCLDSLRRRKNHVSLSDLQETEEPFPLLAGRKMELAEALDQLKPRDRAMFLLREVEGQSYAEIALALDCTIETVRCRLHRARLRLREYLCSDPKPK